MQKHTLENRLSPLIKYPGGKEKELHYIIPALPQNINRYYEPFIGGGAVYFSMDAEEYFINDKSDELISLYYMVKDQNEEFFQKMEAIEHSWNLIRQVVSHHEDNLIHIYHAYCNNEIHVQQLSDMITGFAMEHVEELHGLLGRDLNCRMDNFVMELCRSIKNKMVRMKKIAETKGNLDRKDVSDNIESAFRAAFYIHFRYLINDRDELGISNEFATAIYFFIRQTCYSSMFRYNGDGKFNVPYGGISYNRKSFANKIIYYHNQDLINHLENTTVGNMDFYDFMQQYAPKEDDFVFLDPPYDTAFSTYAKNTFDQNDQKRLSEYLIKECRGNFMIVIKNTEYISSLYPEETVTANGGSIHVSSFDKRYFVSFQDRNNKEAQHLLITNYES